MTGTAYLLALALAVVALTGGCGGAATSSARGDIVAAFYPLAFATRAVTGPGTEVVDLTPAGAEPHDLELTPSDVRLLHEAKLVVYLGQGFQPAVETAVADRSGPSLDLLRGEELEPLAEGRDEPHLDPHVWLDPVRYATLARRIARRLGDASTANGLVARLDALDAEYQRGLSACRRRQIVTSHAAFGYLARRYDLEQVALSGLSPETEPSPKDISRLVAQVRESGATTVFFETLLSPKLAETVAREAGVKTAVLDPIEGLTQAQIDDGADYFSVMRGNLAALREALGCR